MKTKKRKPWKRFRHRVVRVILAVLLYPYARLRYGLRVERFRAQGKRPYLILYNHQTPFDQFFIGMTFRGAVYYVATEDIFSNGWISSLIRFLVAPIPIKKQATDVSAVMNCIRVAREGCTIAIAPEGNRTYSGKTEHMNESIAPLAKKLGLPIAFVRIEGGYGKEPRFSDCIRRGRMSVRVSRVLEPEEYASLTADELFSVIRDELYVNEACVSGTFKHRRAAEYLERAIYVCPHCGLSDMESHGDVFGCKRCGFSVRYLPTKELVGTDSPSPFRFVNDWYEYQCAYIRSTDVCAVTDKPLYTDEVDMSEVIVYKKKQHLAKGVTVRLFGDRIALSLGDSEAHELFFRDVSAMAVCGRNKLNVYYNGHIYQFKGRKRFCALKYVNIFYKSKPTKEAWTHGKFLGL